MNTEHSKTEDTAEQIGIYFKKKKKNVQHNNVQASKIQTLFLMSYVIYDI